jgi:ATP-binding cassette subfamily F protein 3
VALAKLILEEPNVLVLDEPTNHLDIASREALKTVLADFPGTLLFVSHDRYLIDSLVEELWVVDEGQLVRYAGNYSDLAGGRARRLDRAAGPGDGHREEQVSPEQRLGSLEEEAIALASRLAEVAATTSLAQLSELMERYAEGESSLEEAQGAWMGTLRAQLRASSD